MPLNYCFIKNDHYLHTQVTGIVNSAEKMAVMDSITDDPKLIVSFFEIVDSTHVDNFGFGYCQTEPILDSLKQLANHRYYQSRILVAD